MTKRSFLRQIAAAMASPLWTPNGIRAGESTQAPAPGTNWSGNITYSTRNLQHPATVADLQAVVRQQPSLKVQGSRHCFNTIADSTECLVSLDRVLSEDISLNRAASTVTVGAAVKYGQLGPYLHREGFALHNLASLPHISIAGACATATHGSGEHNGNLATAVVGLDMVTASGDLVSLKSGDPEFPAAIVGLGALGITTHLTLRLQPTFQVRQYVYRDLPFASLENHFDQIQASAYSVSLFTNWRNRTVSEVWLKTRTDAASSFAPTPEWLGARLATENLHPIAGVSAQNCTEQLGRPGPWFDRLPHFRMGFTPSAGKELQTEYLVPRRHAVEAILAVQRLGDLVAPHLLISEIRTIAADDFWMSTAYGRPSVAIHFTWKPDWPAVRGVLPVVERELGPFDPRPHWGKLFTIPNARLRQQYEHWDDFLAIARKFDAQGKFRNPFLDQTVFA